MAIWTVHTPPLVAAGAPGGAAAAHERLVFVREGFVWSALILPFVWILWHRLWLVLLGWMVGILVVELIGRVAGTPAGTAASVVYAVWFALSAADLRRWTLERRGWQLAGLVEASGHDEAEQRFFHKLARAEAAVATPDSAASETPAVAVRQGPFASGDAPARGSGVPVIPPGGSLPVIPPGGSLPPVVGFDTRFGRRP